MPDFNKLFSKETDIKIFDGFLMKCGISKEQIVDARLCFDLLHYWASCKSDPITEKELRICSIYLFGVLSTIFMGEDKKDFMNMKVTFTALMVRYFGCKLADAEETFNTILEKSDARVSREYSATMHAGIEGYARWRLDGDTNGYIEEIEKAYKYFIVDGNPL